MMMTFARPEQGLPALAVRQYDPSPGIGLLTARIEPLIGMDQP